MRFAAELLFAPRHDQILHDNAAPAVHVSCIGRYKHKKHHCTEDPGYTDRQHFAQSHRQEHLAVNTVELLGALGIPVMFFTFIFDLYLKLAIGNIGNGNTSLLSTLAIRSNPVGDTKKGEEASCLFQRDKSGVVERGCAGAADVGGKFIEGEALGAGDCLVASHIWFAIAGRSEQQKIA